MEGPGSEWVDIDFLQAGAENAGGMLVQSAGLRRVLAALRSWVRTRRRC
jgi:hypothetical protein